MQKKMINKKLFETPILIDLPLPIITERLMLRAVTPGDGAAMNEAKQETWNLAHKWMLWAKEPSSPEEDEKTVREAYARFILREDMMMAGFDRKTEKPVIYTGLHRFDWGKRTYEIGFWVRKSAQNQGFATEAANALTRYAFDVLQARRVMITHADGNNSSEAVIKKLGYEFEGVMKNETMLPDGRVVDNHIYARVNTNNLPPLTVKWGPEP